MKKANLTFINPDGIKQILTGEPASEALAKLISRPVTIWTGVSIRNSFESQISVNGVLEGFPEKGIYRVLINAGTYTYFKPEDVLQIGIQNRFKDGSIAVIEIEVPKQ